MSDFKYVVKIDENIEKNGEQWDIWSGEFNRKLRKENPDLLGYIFSYWQIQNAKKKNGNTKDLDKQAIDIKKIIKEKLNE